MKAPGYLHLSLMATLAACLVASTTWADDAVKVDVFKGPQALERPLPQYPVGLLLDGVEGWVHVNFMVDTQGKPYEVAVVESSGNEVFDQLAISTVEKWKFTPAMLGNQPTDASEDYKINFTMPVPATGARFEFIRAYKALAQTIDAGDKTSAAEQLQKLEVRNLYEDVFKGLVSYRYHVKWGTQNEQLADLRRALAHERRPTYLPKRDFVAVLNGLLMLQVQALDFGSALDTFERLEKVSKSSARDWQQTIDRIQAVRENNDPVRIHSEMTTHSWHHQLFKDHFQIAVASGKISDIKLRCKKAYVFFHYQPDLQYKVESRSGNCWMELIGDPGTSFDLIQS